jgi:hypothetical protein
MKAENRFHAAMASIVSHPSATDSTYQLTHPQFMHPAESTRIINCGDLQAKALGKEVLVCSPTERRLRKGSATPA